MAVKGAELESELIDTVCERVRERLPADQATPCEAFVRQYYQWVPAEDLADRNPLDLYGAAVAHWNLAQQRAPGEAKVRVYNPDFEQHGWQSPHTLIEIVSDDMPFIVDSVTMDLTRKGYGIDLVIHPVMRIRRDEKGHIVDVLDPDAESDGAIAESILHAEVGREHDRKLLDELARSIEKVLDQVRAAVEDWQAMRGRTDALIQELADHPPGPVEQATTNETKAFLHWLANDNFTFLGYREYDLVEDGDGTLLKAVEGSGLGILRETSRPAKPKKLSPKTVAYTREPQILILTKANSASPVHRPAYLDYIGVKKYDSEGRPIGERRFLGLYTTAAYKASPTSIPIIRGKVEGVLQHAGFPPASHDRKALEEILESYPRDSLFQMETGELFNVAIGILGLGERQRLRLFMWRDPLERFVECLVCIPRDRFNTENRERVGRILLEALNGVALDWTLQLSESRLVRVHYIIRCGDQPAGDYDVATIETRLVQAVRAWTDDLRDALLEEHGEEEGLKLFRRYERAFPPGYQADWVARSAVADIARIEELASSADPITSTYCPLEAPEGMVRLKLFSSGGVLLFDVLPTLEHLGAKVADERPYEIVPDDAPVAWIYDFGLEADAENLERVRDLLHDAFLGVWRGELEDDRLNGLVLAARDRQVPAPGRDRLLGRLHRAHRARPSRHRPAAGRAVQRPPRSGPLRPGQRRADRHEHRRGARRRSQPRRGPHPAQLPERRPRDRPHQRVPERRGRQSPPVPVLQTEQRADSRAAAAPAAVRDLRLLAARGGRAPAGRQGGPGRAPLVGPPRGLPHRDPRADEGADGQERPDRPGRGQGRVRAQAPAAGRRPRGPAGRGHRLLQDLPRGHARRDRQHRRGRGGPAPAGGPLRRRRPVPGGGGRQGHGDVLRHRQRRLAHLRLLARRRVRLGRLTGLRPQGDGDHRARRVGVGQAPFPRARRGHPDDRLHRGRNRRHVRRRVRQRDAPVRAHQADRRVQPHARVHRS
jgi:hypothetical protein